MPPLALSLPLAPTHGGARALPLPLAATYGGALTVPLPLAATHGGARALYVVVEAQVRVAVRGEQRGRLGRVLGVGVGVGC